MTPQQLKKSILQRAIEGRLVEQRAEEGTARELLEEIRAEKERLVKEKKIKKSKPLPPITEEEKPFDIPEGWEWVRLGDVIILLSGQDFPPEKYSDTDNAGLPYITGASSLSETGVNISRWTKEPRCIAEKGDILLVCKGSGYGKAVICDIEQAHIARQIMSIKSRFLDMKYVLYYMQSNVIHIKGNGQGIIPGIDRNLVLNMCFPIPPLEEQHRIVARIEEILPFIVKYDKAYHKLTDFNVRFPEAMKKSLLQYAIQGKLVEQRAEEGTAQDLIKAIQAEKKRLIEEKKIKKTKDLPPVTEEEIPFDIPEGWEWVRLGDIFTMQAGKNIKAANIFEEQDEEHKYLCYGGNGIRGYVDTYNCEGTYPLIGRQGALCGNIHLASGRFYATEHAVVTETYAGTDTEWAKYFLIALNLNQYATATAQPGLAVNKIENVLIPLPPRAEQHRIVAKLEELLPFCNKLNK